MIEEGPAPDTTTSKATPQQVLRGASEQDGYRRLEPMNSIGWICHRGQATYRRSSAHAGHTPD